MSGHRFVSRRQSAYGIPGDRDEASAFTASAAEIGARQFAPADPEPGPIDAALPALEAERPTND